MLKQLLLKLMDLNVNMSLCFVNPCKEIASSLRVGRMSLRTCTHKKLFAHVWPLLFYSTKNTWFFMDLTARWGRWSTKHRLPKHWRCPFLCIWLRYSGLRDWMFCVHMLVSIGCGALLWWTVRDKLRTFRFGVCDREHFFSYGWFGSFIQI